MNIKNEKTKNINILLLGIICLLSLGIFFTSYNKNKREEGKSSLDKETEKNIILIIRLSYIIISFYFLIQNYNEYIESINNNKSKNTQKNRLRQTISSLFIFISSLLNITTTNYEEDIN